MTRTERHENDLPFTLAHDGGILYLTLVSTSGANLLTQSLVDTLAMEIENFSSGADSALDLVISGVPNFSFGADLRQIEQLTGPEALEFAKAGQKLMSIVEKYPSAYAAIEGHCMGGGLDLALACGYRIASPNAVFGHRAAALGLVTGWGGTQRLPRLIGKARAMEIFVTGEKIAAPQALEMGLVDAIADDPVSKAAALISARW